jgi:hypothetical protein
MKKQYIAIIGLWFMGGALTAQNERDAFRYAQYSPTGTARYSALSGSIGAFGADFTVLSANNPAGIGLFKRSEVSLTPTVPYYQITSTYNGEKQTGTKIGFGINNFGIVLAFTAPSNSKWQKIQFATGLNNLARYTGSTVVRGCNEGEIAGTTNFFDYVAQYSNGTEISRLRGMAGDAFNYWLIDTVTGTNNQYYSTVGDYLYQQQIRESSGYLNEWVFSFGGNYDDRLFLGATIGIPFFYYNQKTTYTEELETEIGYHGYDKLEYFDEFNAQAAGVNFKLGAIYQPVKFIRVGAAFHTPTIYLNVTERYRSEYEMWNVCFPTDSSPVYEDIPLTDDTYGGMKYQLTTPFHAIGNLAFIFNKYGFFNIDYEFTNYSMSNLQSNTYNFNNFENKNIKKYFRETHTIRAGGELILSRVSLRLGYAYATNPYKDLNKDGSCHSISGGVGIKTNSFFADFAYTYKFTNDKDIFYDAISVYPYSSRIVNQVFALTIGWKLGK